MSATQVPSQITPETVPSTGDYPETGGQPENITHQIETVISNAVDVSRRLQDAVVTVKSKGFFSSGVQTDVEACHTAYIDLMALAKSTSTEARVNALLNFSNLVKVGKWDDKQMEQTFDYLRTKLPESKTFETSNGKTFEIISSDLKKVAQTISQEAKQKLEKANKKALVAEIALSSAEDQLSASKAQYDEQLPGWLAEFGLDDNVPKWLMLALYVPYDFVHRLTSLGRSGSTVSEIRALINTINRQKVAVGSARKRLNDALIDVENKQEESDIILGYQSTIKTLSADVGGLAPQLNIFPKVVDMVRIDCAKFHDKYKALEEAKAGVDRAAVVADVEASIKLYREIADGLMKFEVKA